MGVWNINVQRMLDCIELHLAEPLSLAQVARRLGYSPFHCTRQFHRVLGLSFRSYLASRRLSAAALELRDTDTRILDLALRWGFGSQEAFSRAFKRAFGISPGAYRRSPVPLPLAPVRRTFLPQPTESPMSEDISARITTTFQTLPDHRFLGLRDPEARDYMDFWARQQARGLDCNALIGLLESLPSRNGQIGGWFHHPKGRGYLYGIEVPVDYDGPVPEGLECTLIPGGTYAVFHHPAYDFEREDHGVYTALHGAMAAWDQVARDAEAPEWRPDDTRPIYQRHGCDTFGQAFCRPVIQGASGR